MIAFIEKWDTRPGKVATGSARIGYGEGRVEDTVPAAAPCHFSLRASLAPRPENGSAIPGVIN
jgi:hypothetical protein